MTPSVDLELVSRTLQQLFENDRRPISYACAGSNRTVFFSPAAAAARTGLLPAFLVTAEAIWTQATGKVFGIEVSTERDTVLGFRVTAIRRGTFSTVMLSLMETIAQVQDPNRLAANDLVRIRLLASTGRMLSVGASLKPAAT